MGYVAGRIVGICCNAGWVDIVGNIRSYPLNIRELRVVKTRSGALVTGGYFIGSGGIKNCSPKKHDCRHFIQPWKSIHYVC